MNGPQSVNKSSPFTEYGASFIALPNEAFVNPRKPDVYQLRQRFYWRPTGFSRNSSGEGFRSRWWLPEEPVQFYKNFGVNRIELKHNGTSKPCERDTPNFATRQYIKAYSTFFRASASANSSATLGIKA